MECVGGQWTVLIHSKCNATVREIEGGRDGERERQRQRKRGGGGG